MFTKVILYISGQFLSGPLDKQQRGKAWCCCRSGFAIQNNTENWSQGQLRITNEFICPIFRLDQTSLHQGLDKTSDRRVEFNLLHLFLYYLFIQGFSYCIAPPIIYIFKLFSKVCTRLFYSYLPFRKFLCTDLLFRLLRGIWYVRLTYTYRRTPLLGVEPVLFHWIKSVFSD